MEDKSNISQEEDVKIEGSSNPMFNRLALTGKVLNTVTLCRDGIDADYYNVKELANEVKDMYNPKISSLVLLKELIHLVYKKEMEPFTLIVIDLNGKEYTGKVDEYGVIREVYAGTIANSEIMKEHQRHRGFIYSYLAPCNVFVPSGLD